ncbi:CDGSH iron-sulfur domain-containing protein, partial [uncultured Alistipes sp.]
LQIIATDRDGECTGFREGADFPTRSEPTALCRCGRSANKPYCDGSHLHAEWDPRLTAPVERLDDGAERIEGGTLTLHDNAAYCVFARFCHPQGDAWTLTEQSDVPEARRQAIREASLCPGGRLTAYDRATQRPFEFHYEPSLGLIEDPALSASGGLWLRGGIPIRTEEGLHYETRNRTVLCRCGRSANKPYCDGTHVAVKWDDGLVARSEARAVQPEPVAAEAE